MKGVPEHIIRLQLEHFSKGDPDYGQRVAEALEVNAGTAAVVGVK